MNLSLDKIERHWVYNLGVANSLFGKWISMFDKLVSSFGEVAGSLRGKRMLAENCTFLLMNKALNHALASYDLVRKGLLIDASLTARNAVETFAMIELFVTDESEKYFQQWADGKEFRPGWVRKELDLLPPEMKVREVVISLAEDDYRALVRDAYKFWSGITHCNLKSAQYSVKQENVGYFSFPVAGGLDGQEALVNCIFAVLCMGLFRTALFTSAIFAIDMLRDKSAQLRQLFDDIMAENTARCLTLQKLMNPKNELNRV